MIGLTEEGPLAGKSAVQCAQGSEQTAVCFPPNYGILWDMEELQTIQNWGRLVNYSYTSIQAVHFTENEILITLLQ
jgi:hypothetical protein